MKDLEVTLYDVFGYLIPGCIAFTGIYLIAWRLVLPLDQDWSKMSSGGWAVVLGIAYVIGHFVQALSNAVSRLIQKDPVHRILTEHSVSSPDIVLQANKRACIKMGLSAENDLTMKTLYDFMDHYLQQHGNTESRNIYVYREGFYRGLAGGLLLLAIGTIILMTGEQGNFSAFGATIKVTKPCAGFLGVFSIIMALLSMVRYRRFLIYRVKNTLYSFLAICNSSEKGGPK